MKRFALALIVVLLLSVATSAAIDIETYKAPAPASILDILASFQVVKATVVDEQALAFLDVFPNFSLGVLIALDELLPITSWSQLVDLQYTSITQKGTKEIGYEWVYGNPRNVMTTSRALIFLTFFDLESEFVWIVADE